MSRKPKTKVRNNPRLTLVSSDNAPDLNLCGSAFDGSPLPMALLTGPRHIVQYVNPAFCRMAGKKKDELTKQAFADIGPWGRCSSLLDHVYRTGETHTHTERNSGARPVWSCAMWPVFGADESPRGVMLQVTKTARFQQLAAAMNEELLLSGVRQHELTERLEKLNAQLQVEMAERIRMERALRRSEKLAVTARFALTMAHEINNPLAAITNLMFLLAPLQTDPQARAYVATVDDQVSRLSRIATQMLKFHRDSNNPTEFPLSEVVRELVDFYGPQAERQGVVVKLRIEAEALVAGFRGEMVQVVTNLLLNAFDASSAGGQVKVHLYPAPPWLCEVHNRPGYCLMVADKGSGIKPQHLARIFEPFFTTKGNKGTGLGLWVSLGIVNRVSGSIRVRSSCSAGRTGTCFLVFIPAETATFSPVRRRYERPPKAAH